MASAQRDKNNPVLKPNESASWESDSVFNASPIKKGRKFHIFYRAVSDFQKIDGDELQVSTIGHAVSKDGKNFQERKQFIKPEHDWEKYGCEDPRVTYFEGRYYIFYTALSEYPFEAEGIKVGVAITDDLKNIEEKHLVTPFNAKAMALFPKRVNGKVAVILSADTDRPPSKTAIAYFDNIEDLWSEDAWRKWYKNIEDLRVNLKRGTRDQIEVGSAPIETKNGWLLVYSEIKNYQTHRPVFTIQAVLLDKDNPQKIIGRTEKPLLVPEADYERYGKVPDIVFPSGAMINKGRLYIYYSGADTVVVLATIPVKALFKEMKDIRSHTFKFERLPHNPIIEPDPSHAWEEKAVFNPAAIRLKGKTHILYRAMANNGTSTIGYASSRDNITIYERLPEPVYVPRKDFEIKEADGNSGCEDPRLTQVGNRIYMVYTAFNGAQPPAAAMTHISVKDFVKKRWNWSEPVLITEPGIDNKDVVLFPRKISNKYVFLHRPESMYVWVDYVNDLDFERGNHLKGFQLFGPREEGWDTWKVGTNTPPIETDAGWVVIYHGVSKTSSKYRLGAVLLEKDNPEKILARTHDPLLEPLMDFEKEGQVNNVVFPCGHVVVNGVVYIYYGGADSVVAVAKMELKKLVEVLLKNKQ